MRSLTGREKIDAAFSQSGTPEIPVVICYEGIYYRDHWEQITDRPWWYAQSPDVEHQFTWRGDAIRNTPQDWFVLPAAAPRADRENTLIEVRGDDVYCRDLRTGRAERLKRPEIGGWLPSAGIHSRHPERPPESKDEIDACVAVPDEFDHRTFVESGRADLAALMLERFGEALCPIVHVGSPLWLTYYLWGFEDMMTKVALSDGLVQYACERYLARCRRQVKEGAALGARAVWIEECLTDYLSPASFRRLNVPLLQSLVAAIRDAGMKSVYYYCGNPNDRWDELFSVGADALSLEESKKGWQVDIEEVVRRAGGRCTILGNLDALDLLENGSEEQLRREIGRQIDAGRANDGRFIMSIGSPVTPGTSAARVRLYCDVTREARAV